MILCQSGAMRIAVYAFDGVTMFHLAAPLMVFGEVGRLGIARDWETRLWSDRTGPVRTAEGYSIADVAGPRTLDLADIVIIPSWPLPLSPISETLRAKLRQSHARGTPIVGLCLGAFAVADAGILDGRAAVTHWDMMPALAERHPSIRLDESVLYVDHGDVMTSAGTVSSVDACLHLVRKHLGSAVATRVARNLVVAPHREGGQAQYIERPLAEPAGDTAVADVLEWALRRLGEPLSVDRLAGQARMSRRSFHSAIPPRYWHNSCTMGSPTTPERGSSASGDDRLEYRRYCCRVWVRKRSHLSAELRIRVCDHTFVVPEAVRRPPSQGFRIKCDVGWVER
jgi:transcriptional regulator GlxA family with amidase domain